MESRSGLKTFYKWVSLAALLIFALLILAFISTLFILLKIDFMNNWLRIFDDNWVVLFFKINLGLSPREALRTLHGIDFALFILTGFLFSALFFNLRKKHIIASIFSVLAAATPFLGIPLLLITHSAGRTGMLSASLIFSILMLLSNTFGKFTAAIGIAAASIILTGCDIFSLSSTSSITAIFIAAGYILWMLWFLLVAGKYYQLGKGL